MKRPKKTGPTVGPSFEVGIEGVNLMRNLLPSNWLLREQSPDFFVDFMIETVRNGEVTGSQFGVQIKATRSKTKSAAETYGFTVKHLRYYLRCPHPIFLFLAHIPTGSIRWVFAQEYILKIVGNDLLERSKTGSKIKIKFNAESSLVDFQSFNLKIESAHQFIRELNPGSIKSAVEWRKKELELKDPRIAVDIDYIHGMEHVTIKPKQDIKFSFTVLNPDEYLSDCIVRSIESGDKIFIPSQNLKVSGLPLIDDASQIDGFTMGASSIREVELDISIPSGLKIRFPAKARVGSKYMVFEALTPNAPVKINIMLPKEGDSIEGLTRSNDFQFLIDPWVGQSVSYLPYFDDVHFMVNSIYEEDKIGFSILWKGNVMCGGMLNFEEKTQLVRCKYIMEWLVAARFIAQKSGFNPILPKLEDISKSQWDTVLYMHAILMHRKATRCGAHARVSSVFENVDSNLTGEKKKSTLSFGTEFASFDFLGTEIFIGPLQREFTNMEIKVFQKLNSKQTRVVFVGDSDSELTESLIEGEKVLCSASRP